MKNIITIVAIVLISSFGFAQQGAKIQFQTADNTIDYGNISKQSDNGVRSVEFTNTGDAPLIITNVLATSGFTIGSKPSAPIAPGRTGRIEIKYNMVPGPIRKTITIESNAVNYDSGRVPLKIKGNVSE